MTALPKVTPLALKRRAAAFDNDGWLFELKYDGFRALLEIDRASDPRRRDHLRRRERDTIRRGRSAVLTLANACPRRPSGLIWDGFASILKSRLELRRGTPPTMDLSRMIANAAKATSLLKALANKHRLIILCHVAGGEKSVGELEELLGMRQAHLSQHLARLRRDDLVKTRRDSRTIYYELESSVAGEIVHLLYQFYCAPRRAKGRKIRSLARQTRTGRPRAAAAGSRAGVTRRR
jgi:DNA-binding transcriptional ArsR family regulator